MESEPSLAPEVEKSTDQEQQIVEGKIVDAEGDKDLEEMIQKISRMNYDDDNQIVIGFTSNHGLGAVMRDPEIVFSPRLPNVRFFRDKYENVRYNLYNTLGSSIYFPYRFIQQNKACLLFSCFFHETPSPEYIRKYYRKIRVNFQDSPEDKELFKVWAKPDLRGDVEKRLVHCQEGEPNARLVEMNFKLFSFILVDPFTEMLLADGTPTFRKDMDTFYKVGHVCIYENKEIVDTKACKIKRKDAILAANKWYDKATNESKQKEMIKTEPIVPEYTVKDPIKMAMERYDVDQVTRTNKRLDALEITDKRDGDTEVGLSEESQQNLQATKSHLGVFGYLTTLHEEMIVDMEKELFQKKKYHQSQRKEALLRLEKLSRMLQDRKEMDVDGVILGDIIRVTEFIVKYHYISYEDELLVDEAQASLENQDVEIKDPESEEDEPEGETKRME